MHRFRPHPQFQNDTLKNGPQRSFSFTECVEPIYFELLFFSCHFRATFSASKIYPFKFNRKKFVMTLNDMSMSRQKCCIRYVCYSPSSFVSAAHISIFGFSECEAEQSHKQILWYVHIDNNRWYFVVARGHRSFALCNHFWYVNVETKMLYENVVRKCFNLYDRISIRIQHTLSSFTTHIIFLVENFHSVFSFSNMHESAYRKYVLQSTHQKTLSLSLCFSKIFCF